MRVLVTGYGGQLGYDVVRELESRKIECIGVSRAEFDLTDFAAVRSFVEGWAPDVVIHCAAYTAVDQAETETELCQQVNAAATRNIAEICRDIKSKLLYVSTDYVFPGDGDRFYEVDADKGPKNVYGRSKLAGEEAVQAVLAEYFIVRVSWVFGIHGRNFIKTMLKRGEGKTKLTIVGDQVGSPTYTVDLARLLCDMAATDRYGVYQASNEGICSWAQFAQEIFDQAQMPVKVFPVGSEEYPTKAVRPKNSRMSKKSLDQAGFSRLPSWQDALRRYLAELAAGGGQS